MLSHITYSPPSHIHTHTRTCIHKVRYCRQLPMHRGFQIPIPRSSACLPSPNASESRPRGNPIQPWRPIPLAHIMLCSHKKRTIFSHCKQLVRSLLLLHSLVKIFLLYILQHIRGRSDTRQKKKKIFSLPCSSPAITGRSSGRAGWEPDGRIWDPPRTEESVEFLAQSFWCISERGSWLRTPESPYSVFGIFDGGHGELRRYLFSM